MEQPKPYSDFFAEEFAGDPRFREWILDRNPEAGIFWKDWLKKNPDKQAEVLRAAALLQVLDIPGHRPEPEAADDAINETMTRIRELQATPPGRFGGGRYWGRYAAAAVLVLSLGWGLLQFADKRETPAPSNAALVGGLWTEVTNSGREPRQVLLPDGSRVTLAPAGILRYRLDSSRQERLTYLEGGAFFEVTRNPERPFLVYTGELVTKVLGTSFHINADDRAQKTKVSVVTGKVAVTQRKAGETLPGSVVLRPNQEIVYYQGDTAFHRRIITDPRLLPAAGNIRFVFDETPLGQVFETLEEAYGIPVRYNKELLANCQLTATLGNESFRKKLELICKPIRASFEDRNGEIVIYSQGCNY